MNAVTEMCPWCEEGALVEEIYDQHMKFGRSLLSVSGLKRCRCSNCDEVITSALQFDYNSDLIKVAERKTSCFVSPAMLRAFREKYALSQREAGRLLGVGEGAFGKYETGSRLSSPTAKLVRVALALPEAAHLLGEEEGMEIFEVRPYNQWTETRVTQLKSIPELMVFGCKNDSSFEVSVDSWKSVAFEGQVTAMYA